MATVDSSADTVIVNKAPYFVVHEGETESFQLDVTYFPPTIPGGYSVQLYEVAHKLDGMVNLKRRAAPVADFKTKTVVISD